MFFLFCSLCCVGVKTCVDGYMHLTTPVEIASNHILLGNLQKMMYHFMHVLSK